MFDETVLDAPSVRFYAQLQRAFDHFNLMLFEGRLTPCPRWPPKFPRLWPPQTPPPELIGDRE
jgi:hypothetical protein